MKSVTVLSLLAATVLAAPINVNIKAAPRALDYEDDAYRYSDNIDNLAEIADRRRGYDDDDLYLYSSNIDNASDIIERRALDYEDDAFRYSDNIDNVSEIVENRRRKESGYEDDAYRYSDNIDNVTEPEPSKSVAAKDADGFNYGDNLNNEADAENGPKPAELKSWEHITTDADGNSLLLYERLGTLC